jgi:hypothetical protein
MPGRARWGAATAWLLALATLPALAACAANSYPGIPLAAGAADPEVQQLARRARAGDRQVQLELGIRYEEGRGVARDRETARRLYLASLADSRFQTQYVPVNGRVMPQNTAIGRAQGIWPRSVAEIRSYTPSRIVAVLRLCGLESERDGEPDCGHEQAASLRQLVQLETSFRACRIRTNYGNARASPYSYQLNAGDFARKLETRRCMFESSLPQTISTDQSMLIWTMWLALSRTEACGRALDCERGPITGEFERILHREREDFLIWFAMREALRQTPSMEAQVGGMWWWSICGLASDPRVSLTDTETIICALVDAFSAEGMG